VVVCVEVVGVFAECRSEKWKWRAGRRRDVPFRKTWARFSEARGSLVE